jgi:hypothetical protein
MRKCFASWVSVLLVTLPHAASADYVGPEVFTCASMEVMECMPAKGCQRVSAVVADLPRFFKVDMKNREITAVRVDDTRKSSIERLEEVEGKLMLQGAEEGREGVRDGLGWTMSVDRERGDMVLTASGEDVAFVVFGACTTM